MRAASATAEPALAAAGRLPRHVAIIMDGNGRWAKARHMPRTVGHREGVKAVRETVRAAADLGIQVLTLYSFSSENWRRPPDEVSALMSLLRYYVRDELEDLHRNNVRMRFIGRRARLAPDIVEWIERAESKTAANTGLTLVIAFNYGAQDEITDAVRRIARQVAAGRLKPEEISPETIAEHLDTAGLPDPDLVIRTSGEKRVSNFLLWQAAYAEFSFVDTLWPDFGRAQLEGALAEYARRERRYGASGPAQA